MGAAAAEDSSDAAAPLEAPAKRLKSTSGDEVTLPIRRIWFEKIARGEKQAEFREASRYWQRRLLEQPDLKRVRFINGRSVDAPRMLCALKRVEVMPVADIPATLAPAPGTPAHREMFGSATEVICLHLGELLELQDPKGVVNR